jgi:hypothetical protein
VAEDGALVPEDPDEEGLEADELLDEELSPLDSFFAAEPLDEPPEDEPDRLSVR